MAEPWDGRTTVGLVVGLLSPLAAGIAFFLGHDAIDRSSPAIAAARSWYLLTLIVATAVVWSMWPLLRPRVGAFAPWGLFALVPVLVLAAGLGTSYAEWDFEVGLLIVMVPATTLYYLGMLILLLVQVLRGKAAAAMGPILTGAAGVCAGFGLVAAYLLSTLREQAEAARRAHQESPTVGVILLLAVVVGLAVARQRAR